MVFMPFLRSVFRERERLTDDDYAILHMLDMFWEIGQLNLNESIRSIRESYKALGAYDTVRKRYNMGANTYITANEQECLLGQIDLHSGGISNTAQTIPLFQWLSRFNNEHTNNILFVSQRLFATINRIRDPNQGIPGQALAENL